MNLVLAQFIHAGSTMLRPTLAASQVETITRILEDPAELRSFKALLRQEMGDGK